MEVDKSVLALLVFVAVMSTTPSWVAAQGSAVITDQINKNLEKRIEAIRENLEREVVKSEGDQRRATSLLGEVRTLDKQLLKAARRSEELRAEESRLTKEYRVLSERLDGLDRQRERRQSILVQRLSSIYRRGRIGSARVMLQAAESAEPIRMARYLAAISQADVSAVRGYEGARYEYRTALAEMTKRKAQSAATRAELKRANASYEKTRVQKVALLARVKAELTVRKIEMKRLKSAEDELRMILTEAPPLQRHEPRQASLRRRLPPKLYDRFTARKGHLAVPLRGNVLRRFGEDSGHGLKSKGIVVRPYRDGRVFSIAAGEVVFAGPFPGLGSTVIINHGDRYHSVYARLDRIGVEVGSLVTTGAQMGELRAADSTLHFELRAEGKAVNPMIWFAGGEGAFTR